MLAAARRQGETMSQSEIVFLVEQLSIGFLHWILTNKALFLERAANQQFFL